MKFDQDSDFYDLEDCCSCDFGFRLFVLVLRSESQVKINVQWWTWSKGKTKIG